MITKDLSTLEALLAAAKAADPMTDAEWAAQRASFVRGEMGMGLDHDEGLYRAALALGDTEAVAALDRAAGARMKP